MGLVLFLRVILFWYVDASWLSYWKDFNESFSILMNHHVGWMARHCNGSLPSADLVNSLTPPMMNCGSNDPVIRDTERNSALRKAL